MKRIKAACLLQTIHFQLKDGQGRTEAVRAVKDEVEHYKASLERSRTKYRILEEQEQPDGSVVLKIRKQYNNYDYGDYLD